LDADDGNRKRGRKLIELSLRSPSENSVAQADWLLRSKILARIATIDRSTSSESIAWDLSRKSEWSESLRAAGAWQILQPFSGRPAVFSSHLANVVLEDFDLAIRIAEFGLQSNEEDRSLRNNLAYALAGKGEFVRATEEINKARTGLNDPQETVFHSATRGFIAYKAGLLGFANGAYRSAISAAEKVNLVNLAAVARLHFAIEALKANDTDAEAIRKEALDKSSALAEPWMHVLIDRVKNFKKVAHTQLPPMMSEDLGHPLASKLLSGRRGNS
jgi:tetratricopeptide (TPR) repeat protein